MDRRYWDSNAFLGLLLDEPGRASQCRAVLRRAEEGKLEIVTSALTLPEVLLLRGGPPVPRDREEQVRDFFSHEYILVHDLDREIGYQAQQLVWHHGIKPKDAVHVATAIDLGVNRFETFDGPLIKKSGTVGNPPLQISEPYEPETLFDQHG